MEPKVIPDDWIVNDSEDEGDSVEIPVIPQVSSISDFTPKAISSVAQNVSEISSFTTIPSKKSAMEPVASSSSSAKPSRPRPRPAYKGANLTPTTSASEISTTTSIPHAVLTGNEGYSLDIAERAKTRTRTSSHSEPRSLSRNGKQKETRNRDVQDHIPELIVIDTSSDDDYMKQTITSRSQPGSSGALDHPVSSSRSKEIIPDTSFGNPLPSSHDRSILPPSDPPASLPSAAMVPEVVLPFLPPQTGTGTPPSSPFNLPKKRKRQRVVADVNDGLYDMDVDDEVLNVKAVKSKTAKAKGSRAEGDVGDKRKRKPREKKEKGSKDKQTGKSKATPVGVEQVFKSKEFITDSEDDLDLLHSTSSAPPTIPASVPPSEQVSEGPSASISALSFATFSDQPSMNVSAPPSPFIIIIPKPRTAVPTEAPCPDSPTREAVPSHLPGPKNGKEKKKDPSSKVLKAKRLPKETSETKSGPSTSDTPGSREANKSTNLKGSKKKINVVLSDDEDLPDKQVAPEDQGTGKGEHQDIEAKSESRPASRANDKIQPVGKDDGAKTEENKENASSEGLGKNSAQSEAPVPKAKRLSHTVPRKGSMGDLIRRVNSRPNSPFASPSPASPLHSPFAKASRSVLSRIAPLHPNRRSPPPPLPKPPPPKKTKKMLEMEERWEMELAESVEGWTCLGDEERASLMRAKRDMELGYED
ncbi:hypothetical protein BD410DRAFT_784713 [Rickenella mellea]|uniref:Uncharacterized protein n=1 Tax=Rickenella mellea TaxID=50990 RepID=A0A4Y7QEA6_9AGAM|nr:hypothetical protein BD410DRAFT_784713 [Rickenella mellea]